MKKIILLLIFIVFTVFAQNNSIDKSIYYNYGERFYTDYYLSPDNSQDSINITFIFKISNASMAFNQEVLNRNKRIFIANPFIEITLADENGIIRKRLKWNDTVKVKDVVKTKQKYEYTYGIINTSLKKGNYNLNVSYLDKYGNSIEKKKFEVKAQINNKNMISKPFFIMQKENINYPLVLNGNISFHSKDVELIILTKSDLPEDIPLTCQRIKATGENEFLWEGEINISLNLKKINKYLKINQSNNHQKPYFTYEIQNNEYNYFKIDLPSSKFVPGNYKLTFGSGQDTSLFYFKVLWERKPISLQKIDYAVDLMEYITTEDELDKIDEGDEIEIFQNLIKYWKTKDPTPSTPYNEAMAEYFRRVDYAAFNYRTIKEKDGAKTDRGKIYILYGEPTNIHNKLTDNKNIVTWEYDNRVNKNFTFEMISTGIYKLTEIQDRTN